MAVDYPKLQDKIDFCRKVNEMSGRKFTYGISYIGEFKLGEGIDEHILEISPCLSANTLPIIIEILKFKGEYVLTYMSHLEKDRYVHALKELFITEGISCTCVQKENFKECIAQF